MLSTLCLDVGSGTQDAYFFQKPESGERFIGWNNCPKMVLPSPAKLVAARIAAAASSGVAVHLAGTIMGGGFYRALKSALEAGLAVSATEAAALSVFDNLDHFRAMGATIRESAPTGAVEIALGDYDPAYWRGICAAAGIKAPDRTLAAAQDHGFHPEGGNRPGRFKLWRRFLLEAGGRPEALLFDEVPPELTRLATLRRATCGPVADTGAAAVLGVLFEPMYEALSRERGLLVVNVGNSHTIAFLVHDGRIYGVFEHHTGMWTPEELAALLTDFRRGRDVNAAVYAAGGHGALSLSAPKSAGSFGVCAVIGPQRSRLAGFEGALSDDGPFTTPAPGGDMMLTGSFGLLYGASLVAGDALPNREKMEKTA